MQHSINAMAPYGGSLGANIRTNDPNIAKEEVVAGGGAVVGDLEHEPRLGRGDHGAGGEVVQLVHEQRRRNGVVEQEIEHGCAGHGGVGQGPVVGHEESDVASECGGWGHVYEHDECEVVGSLHLLSGVEDVGG